MNQTKGNSKEVRTPRYLSLVVSLRKVGDGDVHKELGNRMERAATTASSFEAEQDSGSGPRRMVAKERETEKLGHLLMAIPEDHLFPVSNSDGNSQKDMRDPKSTQKRRKSIEGEMEESGIEKEKKLSNRDESILERRKNLEH
ncbi:hypothetical protein Tco_1163621 [Tanacetum coccineum]